MTRTLADLDWLISPAGNRLHAGDLRPHQADELDDGGPTDNVRTRCGRTLTVALIPGVFSRLSVPRCDRCCDAAGLPRGVGSPKNDDACREVLGL